MTIIKKAFCAVLLISSFGSPLMAHSVNDNSVSFRVLSWNISEGAKDIQKLKFQPSTQKQLSDHLPIVVDYQWR